MEDGWVKRGIRICIDKFDNYVIRLFFDDILRTYMIEEST